MVFPSFGAILFGCVVAADSRPEKATVENEEAKARPHEIPECNRQARKAKGNGGMRLTCFQPPFNGAHSTSSPCPCLRLVGGSSISKYLRSRCHGAESGDHGLRQSGFEFEVGIRRPAGLFPVNALAGRWISLQQTMITLESPELPDEVFFGAYQEVDQIDLNPDGTFSFTNLDRGFSLFIRETPSLTDTDVIGSWAFSSQQLNCHGDSENFGQSFLGKHIEFGRAEFLADGRLRVCSVPVNLISPPRR